MRKLMCKLFGHEPVHSDYKISPYTVHTHWTDVTCKRCGADLGSQKHYFDALTQPSMFTGNYSAFPPETNKDS